eukprot:6186787-Pleurochrysis_carterae.AAC.4
MEGEVSKIAPTSDKDPVTAPVVVVHERVAQWGRISVVSEPKDAGTAGTPSEPSSIGLGNPLVPGLGNSGPFRSSSLSD